MIILSTNKPVVEFYTESLQAMETISFLKETLQYHHIYVR